MLVPMTFPNINSKSSMDNAPYRLPARCQTVTGVFHRPQTFYADLNAREFWKNENRSKSSFDYWIMDQEKRNINSLNGNFDDISDDFRQKPSTSMDAFSRKCSKYPRANYENFMNALQNPQKLLWISDIGQWIEFNSQSLEFVKFAKTAEMHELYLSKTTVLKEKSREEKLASDFGLNTQRNTDRDKLFYKIPKAEVKRKSKSSKVSQDYKSLNERQMFVEKDTPVDDNADFVLREIEDFYDTPANANDFELVQDDRENQIEDSDLDIDKTEDVSVVTNELEHIADKKIPVMDTGVITAVLPSTVENILPAFTENDKKENEEITEKFDVPEIQKSDDETNGKDMMKEGNNSEIKEITKDIQRILVTHVEVQETPFFELSPQKKDTIVNEVNPKLKKVQTVRHRVSFRQPSVSPLSVEPIKPASNYSTRLETFDEIMAAEIVIAKPEVKPASKALPALPELIQVPADEELEQTEHTRDKIAPLLNRYSRRWGDKRTDQSYENELERNRLAELRKQKLKRLAQKFKERHLRRKQELKVHDPQYEKYGFLSKYCILHVSNVPLYRKTFDVCDEGHKQWLNSDELLMALRGVNPNLKDFDIHYLNLVMETCEYHTRNGADFKLFAVLSALSEKITTLDSWIRIIVENSGFKSLEKKTYFCRKLWECIVDPSTKTLPIGPLCVELKAGGVSDRHIEEVRQRFGPVKQLTLLDFLTYIPLFIIMHNSILDNPLDSSEKL